MSAVVTLPPDATPSEEKALVAAVADTLAAGDRRPVEVRRAVDVHVSAMGHRMGRFA